MKLIADEGIDKPIVDHLRSLNHEIIYVLETSPGIDDDKVLALARKEQAVLLTSDTDFGELIFRLKEVTYGIILLRLAGLTKEQKQTTVAMAIKDHKDDMHGAFSVVTKNTIRIRKL